MIDTSHLTEPQAKAWGQYLSTYLAEETTYQALDRAYDAARKAGNRRVQDKLGELIAIVHDDTVALAWRDFQASDELWAAGQPEWVINGVDSRGWK